jgi:hypothetical protein
MKYTVVRYNGIKFKLKPIQPFDFIEENGLPFNTFQVSKGQTVYQKLFGHLKTDAELKNQYDESKRVMKAVISAGVVSPKIDFDKMVATDDAITIFLYSALVTISAPNIRKMYQVKNDTMLFFDEMAKRYACRPSDLMMSGYNDLERLMFDSFVLSVSLENEATIAKKQQAELKRMRSKNGK